MWIFLLKRKLGYWYSYYKEESDYNFCVFLLSIITQSESIQYIKSSKHVKKSVLICKLNSSIPQ